MVSETHLGNLVTRSFIGAKSLTALIFSLCGVAGESPRESESSDNAYHGSWQEDSGTSAFYPVSVVIMTIRGQDTFANMVMSCSLTQS